MRETNAVNENSTNKLSHAQEQNDFPRNYPRSTMTRWSLYHRAHEFSALHNYSKWLSDQKAHNFQNFSTLRRQSQPALRSGGLKN